jgi:hypothetical protein
MRDILVSRFAHIVNRLRSDCVLRLCYHICLMFNVFVMLFIYLREDCMRKLPLIALVSGLALAFAGPVAVQAADSAIPKSGAADEPSGKNVKPDAPKVRPDTRSEKAKAEGAVVKGGAADEPSGKNVKASEPKKRADTRSEKDKAAGAIPKGGAADEPAKVPPSKPKF